MFLGISPEHLLSNAFSHVDSDARRAASGLDHQGFCHPYLENTRER